ncbi:MAG: acyl-CoA reductase [Bacteroidales bacterium]|nr:acyl-CoA reductase [Bacteroidales bacterium]MCF6341948.1 acyl-CoA reductase [Bacteroidales bacterium]
MLKLTQRIAAFVRLGVLLRSFEGKPSPSGRGKPEQEALAELVKTVKEQQSHNGWFVEANVRQMLVALGSSLEKQKVEKWLAKYLPLLEKEKEARTVAVVMAGNIPAVGFHDLLSVLMSGNKLLAKLSSDDEKLLPAIAGLLLAVEPGFNDMIAFTTLPIKNFWAVIATGSNNSARYFQYYFGKYPHIIRKNRNAVAVLTGGEGRAELEGLADDVFSYYGLGCRNVSKLFVPVDYDFTPLLDVLSERKKVVENHKYFNNYEYNKAIFLVNSRKHFDTGTVLLVEEKQIASPVSVLNFGYYQDEQSLHKQLEASAEQIQCVVAAAVSASIPFGKSQQPELWEYADGVDTMQFLLRQE